MSTSTPHKPERQHSIHQLHDHNPKPQNAPGKEFICYGYWIESD